MKRRQVLKTIGLGAGVFIVGPSTLSLLQSCKNEPEYDWQPTFLSASHGFALQKILDVILPATDTPGASDLNIAQFIDSYMNEVAQKEQSSQFERSAGAFSRAFKAEYDKEQEEGKQEDFENIIKKYLKATPAEKEKYAKRNTETQDAQEQETEVQMDADAGAFAYLTAVRGMAIWAWKNSEEVGENVLWYDPVPGQYIPCGPVSELGNGKAMSL
ncbi:gluconate 2-dehydrogenase subunit 3 family protein [Christiangramia sp. SM2212]|uniref:Gluconate 2-dehydrogenase subunit 3 family protein n=1 Tax=Christiangramia sediminicola TaxID=3073267 RepID=A0ABU1EP70_9FLAO|nr:gluconate 2-dehydrogenase subunit 3 family protein [Christiangramia sp. SM2212]MDR5590008.1 gluconate 2-dehydrogenase subunit 3 family protein [Christiangramia sp. SM2212]